MHFGDCELDPGRRELQRAGAVVHLEPQAFDLLVYLIEHRDRVVTKQELLDGVWGHQFLSEANLTTRVKEARRALGDDGVAQHTIRNIRGRGYRFVAELVEDSTGTTAVGLIGRDDDLARIMAALRTNPLVTLTGPGGVGKTALARAVLEGRSGTGDFIDLSMLEPSGDVLSAVALGLEVSLDPMRPATTISAIARRDGLIVLDNCEHVVDGAAGLIERLLAVRDRSVRILATSRVNLGIGGEWSHAVAPLDPISAVSLFNERARAAWRGWDLEGIDRQRVDDVLAGLDRLPLTIEMAAARLSSMTFDDVAEALVTGARVLQVSHRSTGHRHRSLDSLVNWSVGLLSDAQRQLVQDCCAFAGAIAVEDGAVVFDTGPTTAVQLAELAERSLLAADLDGPSARYRLLQTVRSSLNPGFEASGRASAVRERHAFHFADVAENADRRIRGRDELTGRQRFDAVIPELRIAHRWLSDHDPARADAMCTSLHLFTYSSFWSEPLEWGRSLLAAGASVPTPGAHLLVAGAAANRGDLDEATRHARAALESSSYRARATALEILADVAIYVGNFTDAVAATSELRELADALGDQHFEAIAVVDRALAEAYFGDAELGLALVEGFDAGRCSPSDQGWLMYARAELLGVLGRPHAVDAFEEAINLGESVDNRFVVSVATMSLADDRARAGFPDDALHAYASCIDGYLRHGNRTHALTALRNLVLPLSEGADPMLAVTLAAATSNDRYRPSSEDDRERASKAIGHVRGSVSDEQFASWWSAGAVLELEDALRLAATTLAQWVGTSNR